MVSNSRGAVIFITLLGFLRPGYAREYASLQLSEESASNELCNKDAIFPSPPCCGISNQLLNRIVFGNKTELNEFPWMVLICTAAENACAGATLINSRWVLTAAHNIGRNVFEEVRLGEWNTQTDPDCVDNFCKPKVRRVKVNKVIVHPLWKSGGHDIALMHLAEPVTFTEFVKPICLPLNAPEEQTFFNKIAVAAGWGLTEKGTGSDILLKASFKVFDSKRCKKGQFICTTGVGKSTTGSGDSGGPLMLQIQDNARKVEPYFQIGLLHGKTGVISSPKKISVFTYVPAYIEWIKDTILEYQKTQEN